MLRFLTGLLFVSSFVSFGFTACRGEDHLFFHENVLGTSFELHVSSGSRAAAERAESLALAEIDRLAKIYSHYDKSSELSAFIHALPGQEVQLSDELVGTLKLCDQWSKASGGAFNPGVESLSGLWKDAAERSSPPSAEAIADAVAKVGAAHWKMGSDASKVTRVSDASLTLNAIAKGVILDRVAAVVCADQEVRGAIVNIGGDVRVVGEVSAKVMIADPKKDALGVTQASSVLIASGAVATSGDSERHFEIDGKKYSHIIDPRTGQPVSHHASVTVIAGDATTADVLATICTVLTASDALKLVGTLPGVECLLMMDDGKTVTSEDWPAKGGSDSDDGDSDDAVNEAEATGQEMVVEFEIAKPSNDRRFRRPYVAVWIEDKDGFPVKTLSLFLMQNNPGPRWYRDLRRWYRGDQLRRAVEQTNVIETVSKPTRNPGKYKVVWDGRDNDGKPLSEGEYTLLIESAREHGNYRLMKEKFTLGKAFKTEIKPNEEISFASVEYSVKK
ncbi:MAG: DUF2271 domain-containing protein [Planctomycetales bacterium]|nr:DUF2271 domain-containing protein [Planctomycetales bacterium]